MRRAEAADAPEAAEGIGSRRGSRGRVNRIAQRCSNTLAAVHH
ncbi:hypothetical protein [Paenibacillus auburnensis]|nr:hypothetical protein [Paenibacillus auburnensis]